ncbi:hypothetical protein FC093_17295 [Ilyomonas limi]|uniref:TerB family tellurite resistance protein n=1 Tax=Ilyomonas limi TaxID=2575867 RepID=A0A4U3KV46_9BACT|nr:hypothetical protein [Ilyomonas limi]TKK66338.1 hypothetical protein FC093_17295 [Ilyomonas limi]
MKKIILFLIVLYGSIVSIYAQTYDEWFRQKKTQLTYLAQQIAAYQVYANYLNKGYDIAKQGLTAISDLKNGEFNLHQAFFSSFSKINPAIQHYSRIADIITLQSAVLAEYKSSYKNAQQSQMLNSNEVAYIYSVFTALLNKCANDIALLISITTDDQLQLQDDERLQRIDAIYKDIKSKYLFAKSFNNQSATLVLSRQQEQNETARVKTLYNLK